MAARIALVTGGNKGIGLAICERLAREANMRVLLSGRDQTRVKDALAALQKKGLLNVLGLQLDLDQPDSIATAAQWVREQFGGVDILVNNAAIAWKGDAFDGTVASTTIATNYFGTRRVCDTFLPLLRPHGRVVIVSSMASQSAFARMAPQLVRKFLAPELTIPELDALMRQFVDDVSAGRWEAAGWPKTAYGVSKIGESMLTRILARDLRTPAGVLINACCPGYVKTDMSSQRGVKTPDEGADTPVFLALLPPDAAVTGKFFSDRQERTFA